MGPEELSADVALEAAHDLAFGAALAGAAGDVAGAENLIRPGQGHLDHRRVGLTRGLFQRPDLGDARCRVLREDDRLCCCDWPTSVWPTPWLYYGYCR